MLEQISSNKKDIAYDYGRVYPKRWNPYFYVLKLLTSKIEYFAKEYITKINNPVLLDMGCGKMPYRLILESVISKYIGVDIADNQQADIHIAADGQVPLPNSCADIILSTQVLEHVLSPQNYLDECYRLLKPGGFIILSTHGYWCYHPVPTDFWRWTAPGLNKIVQDSNFEVIKIQGIMSLASSAIQLLQFAIEHKVPYLMNLRNVFYFFMQLAVQIVDKLLPMNRDIDACVFFVIAKK